jgi:hypothetical protein
MRALPAAEGTGIIVTFGMSASHRQLLVVGLVGLLVGCTSSNGAGLRGETAEARDAT